MISKLGLKILKYSLIVELSHWFVFRIFQVKPCTPANSVYLTVHSLRSPAAESHHREWPPASADIQAHIRPLESLHRYPVELNTYQIYPHSKHTHLQQSPSGARPSVYTPDAIPEPFSSQSFPSLTAYRPGGAKNSAARHQSGRGHK